MKIAFQAVVATVIAAVVLPAVALGQVKADEPSKTVRITGRMVSPLNSKPAPRQAIKLQASGSQDQSVTETDQGGFFAFSGVRPHQRYDLAIIVAGTTASVRKVEVDQIDLNLGDVVLFFPYIAGRIKGYSGNFIDTGTVRLSVSGHDESSATKIDENGFFTFPAVPTKQHYALQIVVPGYRTTAIDLDVERNVNLGTVVLQPVGSIPLSSVNPPVSAAKTPSSRAARVSGRITNPNGVPIGSRIVVFRNLKLVVPFQPAEESTSILETSTNGIFIFPAESQSEYQIYFTEPGVLGSFTEIGKLEVADVPSLELGNIEFQVSDRKKSSSKLVGTVKSSPSPATSTVAAIFVGAGGTAYIFHSDGKVLEAEQEKEQVGCSSVKISDDNSGVGWLVESDFCCTSYPISLTLVVYRPSKPLRKFTGDGRAIFDWKFVAGGKQVAFYQDFLHGTQSQHYELRDVETERLIDKWDGEFTAKAPAWTKGMQN